MNPAIKIKAGDCFSMVVNSIGDLYTCGKGNFGRLGHGNEDNCYKMKIIEYFR